MNTPRITEPLSNPSIMSSMPDCLGGGGDFTSQIQFLTDMACYKEADLVQLPFKLPFGSYQYFSLNMTFAYLFILKMKSFNYTFLQIGGTKVKLAHEERLFQ